MTGRRPHLPDRRFRYTSYSTHFGACSSFSCVLRQFVDSTDPRQYFSLSCSSRGGGLSNLQIDPQSVESAARTIILCTNFWSFSEEVLEGWVFGQ